MKQWTTGEVAKQRNISVRTLRYYDQINLLTPSFKDDNGKRYYSEDDLFELEKIIILKSLSLSLEKIREMLDQLTYKQILITHYNYLQDQLSQLQTSISNTASLINMMEIEDILSWEHVSEIVRNSHVNSKKWIDYFEKEEKDQLRESVPNISNNEAAVHQYITLLRRIEVCIQGNVKPESDEGERIGAELIALSEKTFQGDKKLMDKFWEVRKLPAEKTGLYPISEEVLEFADRCFTYISTLQKEKTDADWFYD